MLHVQMRGRYQKDKFLNPAMFKLENYDTTICLLAKWWCGLIHSELGYCSTQVYQLLPKWNVR